MQLAGDLYAYMEAVEKVLQQRLEEQQQKKREANDAANTKTAGRVPVE